MTLSRYGAKRAARFAAFAALAFVALALLASLHPSLAMASSLSGGNGGSVTFVKPIQNLGSGVEMIGGALVAIAVVGMIVARASHNEDLQPLFKVGMWAVVAGCIILGLGAFLSSLGVSTSGSVLP